MGVRSQYSRISHHTITTGGTFSVPVTEDFTGGSWSAADLALSEIGVDELGSKAYLRIGNDIKEFNFATLVVGGVTGSFQINDGNNGLTGIGVYDESATFISVTNGSTIGDRNTFFGINSGLNVTSVRNTFIGGNSGANNTTGGNNNFFGFNAGATNISGTSNIYIGNNTASGATSGGDNIFMGEESGSNTNSSCGIFIGRTVGLNGIGDNNIYIGIGNSINNNGVNNISIGHCSGPTSNVSNSISLGRCVVPLVDGELAIGSTTVPINTGATGNAIINYLCASINGTYYKLALYD